MGIFDKPLNEKEKLQCLELDIKFKSKRIKELEEELEDIKSKLSYSKRLIKELRGYSLNDPTLRGCINYLHNNEFIGEVDYASLMCELESLYELANEYLEKEEEDEDS